MSKRRFTSIPNSSGTLTKTAIKDSTTTRTVMCCKCGEYDWVAYGDVPRTSGAPTGIPSGAQLARVTVNDYYKETPNATDTTTNDADEYHLQTDNLLRAVKSSEVRSSTSSSTALSRTELTYDNSATTGNVTAQKNWDSTKGSISRPLTSGNSISASNSYSTWYSGATGRLTSTTDAKGNVTAYTYATLNGTGTEIYPTETVAASSTSIRPHD